MASTLCSFLSSRFHPHSLSPILKPQQLKPYLFSSSRRATPPDSGDSPPESTPSLVDDELKYSKKNRKKKKKNVTRRDPIDIGVKRVQAKEEKEKKEEVISGNEGAFVVTWLGLGLLILVEGVTLAASGFLPDEWDKLLVKYLYPAFTPTVFLFVGGSVAYGVIKYLEAEKMKKN